MCLPCNFYFRETTVLAELANMFCGTGFKRINILINLYFILLKAREILKTSTAVPLGGSGRFAVIAKSQSVGRGTRGRVWDSNTGNLFLTVVFKIREVKIPLTLVPLRLV